MWGQPPLKSPTGGQTLDPPKLITDMQCLTLTGAGARDSMHSLCTASVYRATYRQLVSNT